jgi:hypothetical protein
MPWQSGSSFESVIHLKEVDLALKFKMTDKSTFVRLMIGNSGLDYIISKLLFIIIGTVL